MGIPVMRRVAKPQRLIEYKKLNNSIVSSLCFEYPDKMGYSLTYSYL
jgi:hypothetical protein